MTKLATRLLKGIGSVDTAVFHTDTFPQKAFALARGFLILGKAEYGV